MTDSSFEDIESPCDEAVAPIVNFESNTSYVQGSATQSVKQASKTMA